MSSEAIEILRALQDLGYAHIPDTLKDRADRFLATYGITWTRGPSTEAIEEPMQIYSGDRGDETDYDNTPQF